MKLPQNRALCIPVIGEQFRSDLLIASTTFDDYLSHGVSTKQTGAGVLSSIALTANKLKNYDTGII